MAHVYSASARHRAVSKSVFSNVHPNPSRIAGIAIGVALHIVALLILIRPMQMQFPMPSQPIIVVPERIRIEPPKQPPPLDAKVVPPKPIPPVVHQQPVEKTPLADTTPRTDTQAIQTKVVETPDTVFALPPADPAPPSTAEPISGVELQYAIYPSPDFPVQAIRDNAHGTVLLLVLVDVDGRPLQVDIKQSSGNRHLDRAAREQVLRKWTFKPAIRDGVTVQAIGLVPINFNLN